MIIGETQYIAKQASENGNAMNALRNAMTNRISNRVRHPVTFVSETIIDEPLADPDDESSSMKGRVAIIRLYEVHV